MVQWRVKIKERCLVKVEEAVVAGLGVPYGGQSVRRGREDSKERGREDSE